eukprot:GHVN01015510.1.p1 GENE.GHVN01015510.1~~GHVN01015510.1.p1  ORF type:complete len:942 (+),score=161.45 GHVN01015510.1:63-2888(+)
MGNQLVKSYDVDKSSERDCGPHTRWKLLQASHKERSSEVVTVFAFDKRQLETYAPSVKDAAIQNLTRDAHWLSKLRHPNLLQSVESLMEDRASLTFVTRPVTQTLRSVLSGGSSVSSASLPRGSQGGGTGRDLPTGFGGMPAGGDTSVSPSKLEGCSMLERKAGLLDVCEAIAFLHEDAKVAHLAVSPHSIFVTPSGRWVLGGLAHAQSITPSSGSGTSLLEDSCISFQSPTVMSAAFLLSPPLQYSAPELTATCPGRCGTASDVFSLGLIMGELFNTVTLDSDFSSHKRLKALLTVGQCDRAAHQDQCRDLVPLKASFTSGLPSQLLPLLTRMLSVDHSQRPPISEVIKANFFQDISIKALRFLETIREKEDAQKSKFLQGLPSLLQQQQEFQDDRVLRFRVIPKLIDCLTVLALWPLVMNNLLIAMKKATSPQHFQSHIWPSVKPLLTAKEIQIETVLIVINHIDYIVSLCTDEMIDGDVMPFVLKCLEIPAPSIQDCLLSKLPSLSKRFDYQALRSSVLPRLLQLVVTNSPSTTPTSNAIINKALGIMVSIADKFDRTTVNEHIIGCVEKLTKQNKSGPVCLAVVGALRKLAILCGTKTIAQKVLPILTPLLAEDSLTEAEYGAVRSAVDDLLKQVDAIRSKEFEQNAAVQKGESLNEVLGVGGKGINGSLGDGIITDSLRSLLGGDSPSGAERRPSDSKVGAPPPPPKSIPAPGAKATPLSAYGLSATTSPTKTSSLGDFDFSSTNEVTMPMFAGVMDIPSLGGGGSIGGTSFRSSGRGAQHGGKIVLPGQRAPEDGTATHGDLGGLLDLGPYISSLSARSTGASTLTTQPNYGFGQSPSHLGPAAGMGVSLSGTSTGIPNGFNTPSGRSSSVAPNTDAGDVFDVLFAQENLDAAHGQLSSCPLPNPGEQGGKALPFSFKGESKSDPFADLGSSNLL